MKSANELQALTDRANMKRYTLEMLDDGYGTKDPCMLLDARGEYVKYGKARKLKKKCDRLAAEVDELRAKLDAVVAILEAENVHPWKPGRLGTPDASRTPRIADIHARAVAIAEGREGVPTEGHGIARKEGKNSA